MKRNAVIILMLAAVLTLGGCGKSEQKAPEEETKTGKRYKTYRNEKKCMS